jgi:hypothetical protein
VLARLRNKALPVLQAEGSRAAVTLEGQEVQLVTADVGAVCSNAQQIRRLGSLGGAHLDAARLLLTTLLAQYSLSRRCGMSRKKDYKVKSRN